MPQIKKNFVLVLALLLIQLALSITGGILVTSQPIVNKINQGVYINDLAVGGLTKKQAVDKITDHFPTKKQKIKLNYHKTSWAIEYDEIGASINYTAAVEQAYHIGRDGNIFSRICTLFRLQLVNNRVTLPVNFSQGKLINQLKQISAQVDQPAIDATINLQDDTIKIIADKTGIWVDIKDTLINIDQAIKDQQNKSVSLIVKKRQPNVVADDLKDIKDPLSIAVTSFDLTVKNRVNNIKLASQTLNGTVIKPKQEYSFNEKVGLRLKVNGYKEAPVFDEGKVVSGVGGGVCQVSTTLYNALLNAGLEIKERSPHTKPVAYVPIGQDAAVADGKLDLKFVNNLDYPVGIIAQVENNNLIIRFFGKQEKPGQTVRLVSEGVHNIEPKVDVIEDANLNKGYSQVITPGEKGYHVQVYRVWYEKNKQIKKELINETDYEPLNTVIRIGTKAVPGIQSSK